MLKLSSPRMGDIQIRGGTRVEKISMLRLRPSMEG